MRKFVILICKLMIFSCSAMGALFTYDLFFWSDSPEDRLASKVIILALFLAGSFFLLVHALLSRKRQPCGMRSWEGTEPEGDPLLMGYAVSRNGTEPYSSRTPRVSASYRSKVVCLTALGYAWIIGVIAAILYLLSRICLIILKAPDPFLSFLVSTPFLLVLTMLLGSTLKLIWIRAELPEGLEITRYDAPELFETVERIRDIVGGPRVSRIVLTGDFNACIARSPRLGIFGWHRNELMLGLPLLLGMSTRQMLAVLAHEYGHLSTAHGRVGSWVYGTRKAWMQILGMAGKKRRWSQAPLARFFGWYAPFFQSYTSTLARAHEHEADRCSAMIAGSEQTAAALVRFEVLDRYLHEGFWPMVSAMMDTQPYPVDSVYGLMQEKLKEGIDEDRAGEWIEAALQKEAAAQDTHPCLKSRLQALGEKPDFRNSREQSAAQYFFPHLEVLMIWIDDEWRARVKTVWLNRYVYVQKLRRAIAALVSKARHKPLSVGETLELAHLTEEFSGRDRAFPFYERILKYKPSNVPALCAVGRISLEKGDESGVGFIEKAIALDPSYGLHWIETLYNFYAGKGDLVKTGKYYQLLSEQREALESAYQGRKTGS